MDDKNAIAVERTPRFQFSLATVLIAVSTVACIMWLGRLIGATYTGVAVGVMLLAIAGGWRHRWTRRRLPVALVLASLHTLLVAVAAGIDLNGHMDDMSPSLLLFMALYYVDLPIVIAIREIGDDFLHFNWDGNYAALSIVGGLFWFFVGAMVHSAVALGRSAMKRNVEDAKKNV